MSKINIEVSSEYREYLDLLKQIIPNMDWSEIKEDSQMIEVLIQTFVWFIQEQAANNDSHWDHSHVHWPDCNH